MFRLLRFLITGSWHEHKYKTIQTGPIIAEGYEKPIGQYYIKECECGKIKTFKSVL